MDRATVDYYDRNAAAAAARYRSVDLNCWRRQFQEAFRPGSRVLDVGAGSGRDLALLLKLGFDAYGLEPTQGMRIEATKAFPELAGRIYPFALPVPEDADTGDAFDGILCSAMLMHLPEAELPEAALSLRRLLRDNGRLLIYVPATKLGQSPENRDDTGRLFRVLDPENLLQLFEPLDFQLLRRWQESDRLNRTGITWNGLLFELNRR